MEQNIKQVIDDHRLLNALLRTLTSRKVVTAHDLDLILDVTIQKVVQAISAEAITVFMVEGNKILFKNIYYSKKLYEGNPKREEEFMKMAKLLQTKTLDIGEGIVGKVILDKKSHIANSVGQERSYSKRISEEAGFEVRSLLTVPLVVNNASLGAIQVVNKVWEYKRQEVQASEKRETGFVEQDLMVLEEVARYSARVIQKAQDPHFDLSDEELAQFVARMTGYAYVKIDKEVSLNEKLLDMIGEEIIRNLFVLPLAKTSTNGLKVAMSDPLDIQKKDSFQLRTKHTIDEIVITTDAQIKQALDKIFRKAEMSEVAKLLGKEFETLTGPETIDVAEDVDENSSPIVQLASKIIEDAYIRGASDIHIEPFEKEISVRYRVDGGLQEVLKLPPVASKPLTSRFKIMSNLDIAERRLPQDGRIMFKQFSKSGIDVDLRVSTAPVVYGEKICMRLLDKKSSILKLEQMGFSEHNVKLYRTLINKPYGMILHVGPTGSGKTTTLYAALQEINTPDINIQTAEDPVEYMLQGINQMQMKREIGLTFARALRCFLRQDPDVILVGEIRDSETAEISIEAALTGHLLFSTLHTNDAAGTIVRFLDMDIEPFLVSSALLGVCAQRLLRRLCPKCKDPYEPDAQEQRLLGIPEGENPTGLKIYRAKGCSYCNGNGYKGRLGTHELLVINPEIRDLIVKRLPSEAIKECAVKHGMITLFQDAVGKVKQGVTSLQEALAIVMED